MNRSPSASTHIMCPACHTGVMRTHHAIYIRAFGNLLVTAPNMLAWRCDVCRQTLFSPQAVQNLEMLVGLAGQPITIAETDPVGTTPVETVIIEPTVRLRTETKRTRPKAKP